MQWCHYFISSFNVRAFYLFVIGEHNWPGVDTTSSMYCEWSWIHLFQQKRSSYLPTALSVQKNPFQWTKYNLWVYSKTQLNNSNSNSQHRVIIQEKRGDEKKWIILRDVAVILRSQNALNYMLKSIKFGRFNYRKMNNADSFKEQ